MAVPAVRDGVAPVAAPVVVELRQPVARAEKPLFETIKKTEAGVMKIALAKNQKLAAEDAGINALVSVLTDAKEVLISSTPVSREERYTSCWCFHRTKIIERLIKHFFAMLDTVLTIKDTTRNYYRLNLPKGHKITFVADKHLAYTPNEIKCDEKIGGGASKKFTAKKDGGFILLRSTDMQPIFSEEVKGAMLLPAGKIIGMTSGLRLKETHVFGTGAAQTTLLQYEGRGIVIYTK
jgi:hypothetical protein